MCTIQYISKGREGGECFSVMGYLKTSWTKLLNLYANEMIINEREFNGV